jgi:hypothetical protein
MRAFVDVYPNVFERNPIKAANGPNEMAESLSPDPVGRFETKRRQEFAFFTHNSSRQATELEPIGAPISRFDLVTWSLIEPNWRVR